MTYAELLKKLQKATPEQLKDDVTIRIDEEFYPVSKVRITGEDDVLHKNHIFFDV